MKKFVIAAVVIVALLVGAYLFLGPSSPDSAVLYVERGSVEVRHGTSWSPATDELVLSQGDGVRTQDGEATVVLLEGEILHLEPNSEVSLDSITSHRIDISQISGQTLSKVTKLSGISEYSVRTPNTVATVRGTEFSLDDDELDVADGEVEYGSKDQPLKVKVHKGKRARKTDFTEEGLTGDRLTRLQQFPEKYVKILKRVRAREIKKHTVLLSVAAKKGFSERQLEESLTEVDDGKTNEDELYGKVPGPMKNQARRTYLLTKEIKRAKQKMAQR